MSYKLIKEVWRLALTPTQQQVLMAMADYADDDGRNCFPSQPRLAWKTGLSESTVLRTIDKLIAMSILQVLRPATNKAPARYQICLDMGAIKEPFSQDNVDFRDSTVLPQSESRDVTVLPQDGLGWQRDTSRDSTVTARDSTVLPDPIINQSYNQPANEIEPFPEKAPELTAAERAQKWSLCVEELGAQFKTMAEWLQGSELLPTGRRQDDKPVYQVLVVDPHHVEWIRERAGRNIRWRLSSILGQPVDIEIIAELPQAVTA
jgi:hypothetical protein